MRDRDWQRCPSCGSVRDAGTRGAVGCGVDSFKSQGRGRASGGNHQLESAVPQSILYTVLYYQHIAMPSADTLLNVSIH